MSKKSRISPLKSIRLKCLDCAGNEEVEIRLCPILDCPLYPFRMGKNLNRKGIGNKNARVARKRVEFV